MPGQLNVILIVVAYLGKVCLIIRIHNCIM